MKNLSGLLIAIIISSCSTLKHVSKQEVIYGIDFRPYTEKGFLFTPEKYLGEYASIGIVSIEIYPEYNYVDSHLNSDNQFVEAKGWQSEGIEIDTVLNKYHERLVAMGADAVMNFKTTTVNKNYNTVVVVGLKMEGFAIKRK